MDREKYIEQKVNEYRSNLTFEEIIEITPEWYIEAKQRATIELNKEIENARKNITIDEFDISVNEMVQKGSFFNIQKSNQNGSLYFKSNELIDFSSEYYIVVPSQVVKGIKELGFRVNEKLLK